MMDEKTHELVLLSLQRSFHAPNICLQPDGVRRIFKKSRDQAGVFTIDV